MTSATGEGLTTLMTMDNANLAADKAAANAVSITVILIKLPSSLLGQAVQHLGVEQLMALT